MHKGLRLHLKTGEWNQSERLVLTLLSSFSSLVPSLFLLLFPYQSRMVSVLFPLLEARMIEQRKKEERRKNEGRYGNNTGLIRDGATSV